MVFGVSAVSPAPSTQCSTCGDPGFRGSDYCLTCDKPRVLLVYCKCGGSTRWAWFYKYGCRNQLNNPPCSASSTTDITVGEYQITPSTKHKETLRAQTVRLAALRLKQANEPRRSLPLPPPSAKAFMVSAREAAIVCAVGSRNCSSVGTTISKNVFDDIRELPRPPDSAAPSVGGGNSPSTSVPRTGERGRVTHYIIGTMSAHVLCREGESTCTQL